MRTHGTLTRWNEERGFGFIAPARGIPKDGARPCIGELISFEVEPGNDGRKRAVRIMRPGQRVAPSRSHHKKSSAPKPSSVATAIGLLAIAAIGAYGYSTLAPGFFSSATPTTPAALKTPASSPARSQNFHCDGRTHCSQMTSCAEAKNFLRHCPNTTMDGDGDGRPCEQQWCN